MSGLLNVNIFVVNGIPEIPENIHSIDASNAPEGETVNIEKYYDEKYQIGPGLKIYSSQNPVIVNLARYCSEDQRIKFIYKKDEHDQKSRWLFLSGEKVFLNFFIKNNVEKY